MAGSSLKAGSHSSRSALAIILSFETQGKLSEATGSQPAVGVLRLLRNSFA